MNQKQPLTITWMLVACILQLTMFSSPAQSNLLVNAFNTADEVADTANGGANAWQNWFGQSFYQVVWDVSDASNNLSSGSLQIQAFYPNSGIGGCCGPQFVAMNGYGGLNPPVAGNGGPPTSALATNIQFDVRFDPTSIYDTNNNNWPTIEVGTRGTTFNQYDFGTFTIPHATTNWVHVVIPIAASANWSTMQNVFFKFYSTSLGGWLNMFVDNITFQLGAVQVVPPQIAVQKPVKGLRVFAGSTVNTYDREHLTAIDTNQSWVGGTYPVSYSYKLLNFPSAPTNQTAVFRFHIFLIPMAFDGGNATVNNEYLEYQASDNLWLNVTTDSTRTNGLVQAELAWKTNLPNANPDQIALRITNTTAVGTWTLTFNSATAGTLTAPGAAAVPFSLPADAVPQFANPVILQVGVQPDSGWGEGLFTDVAKIQTIGVASPGVPINSDFTTSSSIDTNVWDVSNSAQLNSLVQVTGNAAWWVYWQYPDYGAVLAAKADLSQSATNIPWKTPLYYTGYNSNSVFQGKMGNNTWALLPPQGLPTVDGLSNGIPSGSAFFRVQSPAPAQ